VNNKKSMANTVSLNSNVTCVKPPEASNSIAKLNAVKTSEAPNSENSDEVSGKPVSGGVKAVITALTSNILIAIVKFIAFSFTRSASMLAEAIHSVADCTDQLLLLFGKHRSNKEANRQHPLGHGREQYFWAFIVAIVLFIMGGLFAINEARAKWLNPHSENKYILIALAVLLFSFLFEGYSLFVAKTEVDKVKKHASYIRFIRKAKSPELIICLLEDGGALIGLFFASCAIIATYFTGDGRFDAVGSALIGALLITVAIVLAIELKSLLIGESVSPKNLHIINRSLLQAGFITVLDNHTTHLAEDEILVLAKVEVEDYLNATEISDAINNAEETIRTSIPEVKAQIYIEVEVPTED
jgi:cation diffusion facilitator family transporter